MGGTAGQHSILPAALVCALTCTGRWPMGSMRGRKDSCSLRTGPWVQLAHDSSAGRQAGE